MDLKTRTTHARPVEAQPSKGDDLKTYPRGRVCAAARVCPGTILSIYHEGPDCHQCSPGGHRMLESAQELDSLMAQGPE